MGEGGGCPWHCVPLPGRKFRQCSERGQVCVFQGCARDLCSTNFSEINPATEGLPASRKGRREVGRKRWEGMKGWNFKHVHVLLVKVENGASF